MIAKIFKNGPYAKILVLAGNNHVLKNRKDSIRLLQNKNLFGEYLLDFNPNMKMFSIGQVIGSSVFEDDFRVSFSYLEGAVAFDLDDRLKGWKSGIAQSMAIKPTEVSD